MYYHQQSRHIIDNFIKMKTLGRFVLVDNSSKKEMFLEWKTHAALNRTSQKQTPVPMSYSTRKNIISELKPVDLNENSHVSHKNSLKSIRASTSTKHLTPFFYANPERQNTGHSKTEMKTFYRTRSLGKLSRQTTSSSQKHKINTQKLRATISESDRKKGRTIGILKMRREGLRFRITHNFFTVSKQIDHESFTKLVKAQLFQQFLAIPEKRVYLFHLSKQPINNINLNLDPKQFVIFADVSPKFDVPFQMQMRLFQQASIIEEEIKVHMREFQELGREFGVGEEEEEHGDIGKPVYEWQKIKNIKKYVDRLVQNPMQARQMKKQSTQLDQVQVWCAEKYTSQQQKQKKPQKNPFFDVQSHFPKETTQSDILFQAAIKIDHLPTTINKHEIKQRPIQNMMEKIKRENQDALLLKKIETERIKTIGYKSQKQILKELDQKNIPLAYQNIPYMMQKYGITRAEAYNLFNLYKSLQKISAMRLYESNEHKRVKQKGIDRKTFDEGLKRLEINPGDEVVRNICYFPEFITWEQFIKIISISMRKTPKSKLEAILEGLGSNEKGFLTIEQIGIMVGSSLQKIFGRDEPELKKYFVSVVMKELDQDKSGTIQIQELKEHVLKKGIQDLDLVSYLMLNS